MKSIDYFDKVSFFLPLLREKSRLICTKVKKLQTTANKLADEYFAIAHEISALAVEYKKVESD